MQTVTVSVVMTPYGFGVECSRCGLVSGDDAIIYNGQPTWHARYKASEAVQRHMCP